MKQKDFITGDLWLATALTVFLKTLPDFKVQDGKTLFIFAGDEMTYRAISDFNGGVAAPLSLYSETAKRLKVEMLTRRQTGGQR